MRIAILTLPLGHNYGGILQAYALQKFLMSLGHDVEFLNRRHDVSFKEKTLNLIKQVVKVSSGRAKNFKTRARDAFVLSPLIEFRDSKLKLTRELYSRSDLSSLCMEKKYDAIIVGSDQVWRPCYSPLIENYFLDFLDDFPNDILRISYAASFGVGVWEYDSEQSYNCRNLLKKFDAISVRESEGVELVRNFLNADADYMADPTLLIDLDDYIFPENGTEGDPGGICTYILDSSAYKSELVAKLAVAMDLDVINNKSSQTYDVTSKENIGDCVYVPVERWLENIRNSEFVVTDSFHGCVFSILFNKNFIVVGNKARGLSRFSTLLKVFGLEERMLLEGDGYESIISSEILWDKVNHIRNDLVLKAKAYINNSLGV